MLAKRLLDLTLGTLLCLLALPLILVLAIGIALTLRTWPFFLQQRVGRNGRIFSFPKLRTLPRTTPRYADKYSIQDVKVPRLARALRKYHLDELPQLLLVPIGRMTLVGPRPEMVMLLDRMDDWFVEARTTVTPGVTGLWQVSIGSAKLIGETPEYDLAYLQHRSFRLDLWILWRTVAIVLGIGRPGTLSDVPAWAFGEEPIVEPVAELQRELSA